MLTQHILQNRSYVIALEGVACSEAATRASHWVSLYQGWNTSTAKRIVARHLECSLPVLESKRSLAGKLTYFIYSKVIDDSTVAIYIAIAWNFQRNNQDVNILALRLTLLSLDKLN